MANAKATDEQIKAARIAGGKRNADVQAGVDRNKAYAIDDAVKLMPGLAPGRSLDVVPFWGITPISFLPWNGSAIVYWDSGNPPPPGTNLAPHEPEFGSDPHENPRRTPAAQQQKSDFLRNGGVLVDTCNGLPCLAPP